MELSDPRVVANPPTVTSVMDGMGETILQSTRTLTLGMTEDGDSGGYECRASNAATPGLDTQPFQLIVQSEFHNLLVLHIAVKALPVQFPLVLQ